MRRMIGLLATVLAVAPSLAHAGDRFDGAWLTTVSCEASRGALGYSYRILAQVKQGAFHGLHGVAGEPGSLRIDGTIADDGAARLYGDGRTNSKEFVPGRETQKGTEYGYNIIAHFDAATGTGTRVEGRPCSFQFTRQ
jgi:hypothetical protein